MMDKYLIILMTIHLSLAMNCDVPYTDPDDLSLKFSEDIAHYQFDEAEEDMNLLDQEVRHSSIEKLLDNDKSNFHTILSFANYIQDLSQSVDMLAFLYRKHETSESCIYKVNMRQIIRSLLKITSQSEVPQEVKDKATDLLDECKKSLLEEETKSVLEAVKNKRFDKKLSEIISDVWAFDKSEFSSLVQAFASSLTTDFEYYIHEFLDMLATFDQKIAALKVICDDLKTKEKPSSLVIFLIKRVDEMSKDASLKEDFINDLVHINNTFPDSLKTALFAPRVCIDSVYYKEYLYPMRRQLLKNTRHVFTWGPASPLGIPPNTQNFWEISLNDDEENTFSIKSFKYEEYMRVSNEVVQSRRDVYTSSVIDDKDTTRWYLVPIPDNDNVFIRHFNGDYFYPGDNRLKRDKNRRHVFTWENKGYHPIEGVWKILPC